MKPRLAVFRCLLWLAVCLPFAISRASNVNPVPQELRVIDPAGLTSAEQPLLASLQGQLNRTNAVLWVKSGGMNARILAELTDEGVRLRPAGSVWALLAESRGRLAGFITCDADDASFNVATSLAGPRRAVVLDASLRGRAEALGLRELFDARGLGEAEAFAKFGGEFARGLVVHQSVKKRLHLRDFAVARDAFTFFDVTSAERIRLVRALGPNTRVFGWGGDEHDFVRDVSAGGGAVIPADWSLNLSALQHLPATLPPRPARPEPASAKADERIVAFVVSDGDNIQWMGGGFVDAPGFWASPHRGEFPVTWEMAPALAEFAPRVLAHFLRTATTNDDFVAGPSGYGYQFPNFVPDRATAATETARAVAKAQLRLVSVLNSGGGMAQTKELLERPEADGVLYKDYAPYNKGRGAVWWHGGKPCASYRFLLWELKQPGGTFRRDALPEGVAEAIAALPADAAQSADSFALVNVHAWSFKDSGGPMGAIHRTIGLLPPNTRVVTATEFFALLRQVAPKR